eukprot:scaffold49267_cov41-Tisochrysis_lutea.AAC.1
MHHGTGTLNQRLFLFIREKEAWTARGCSSGQGGYLALHSPITHSPIAADAPRTPIVSDWAFSSRGCAGMRRVSACACTGTGAGDWRVEGWRGDKYRGEGAVPPLSGYHSDT